MPNSLYRITSTTWGEATRRFPEHTSSERLESFSRLVKGKKIPSAFTAYCEGALQAEQNKNEKSLDVFTHELNRARLIEGDITGMSCEDIRSKYKHTWVPVFSLRTFQW